VSAQPLARKTASLIENETLKKRISKCRMERLNTKLQILPPGLILRPAWNGSANLRAGWTGTLRNHMPNPYQLTARMIGACLRQENWNLYWTDLNTDRL